MEPDFARYHRQMLLPGLGQAGQSQLSQACVLIAGCGGLGCMIASLLARAGVGRLVLIDRDVVEITNIQRQVLFDEQDVAQGLPKAEAARRHLQKINAQVRVTACVADLGPRNAQRILTAADEPVRLLLDGLDNFETRLLLNDLAVKHGLPYIYGGAVGTSGVMYPILPHSVAQDRPWDKHGLATPCLRCIMEQAPPPGAGPTCDTVGVLGPLVTAVASLQSLEAIKILTGNWSALATRMLTLEGWSNACRAVDVRNFHQAHACVCCGQRRFDYLEGRLGSSAQVLCGSQAVQLLPGESGDADLEALARRLGPQAHVSVNDFVLRAELEDQGRSYELTLFRDGRALIKGTSDPAMARSLFSRFVGM